MEKRQLELLKKQYNAALKRYNKMEEWIETATQDEQLKHYNHIVEVIKDCNSILNEIKAIDLLIAPPEILYGFRR